MIGTVMQLQRDMIRGYVDGERVLIVTCFTCNVFVIVTRPHPVAVLMVRSSGRCRGRIQGLESGPGRCRGQERCRGRFQGIAGARSAAGAGPGAPQRQGQQRCQGQQRDAAAAAAPR